MCYLLNIALAQQVKRTAQTVYFLHVICIN